MIGVKPEENHQTYCEPQVGVQWLSKRFGYAKYHADEQILEIGYVIDSSILEALLALILIGIRWHVKTLSLHEKEHKNLK